MFKRSNHKKEPPTSNPSKSANDLDFSQFGIKPISNNDLSADDLKLLGMDMDEIKQLQHNSKDTEDDQDLLDSLGLDFSDSDDEKHKNLLPNDIRSLLKSSASEITEDSIDESDLNDPELIAELSRLGIGNKRPKPVVENKEENRLKKVKILQGEIQKKKIDAVKLKREGDITAALATMKEIHELEKSLNQITGNMPTSSPNSVDDKTVHNTVETPVVQAKLEMNTPTELFKVKDVSGVENDLGADVEVTDEDLNNPAYLDELQALGFDDDVNSVSRNTSIGDLEKNIQKIGDKIAAEKKNAVNLKRCGKIPEAVEAMRCFKSLEKEMFSLKEKLGKLKQSNLLEKQPSNDPLTSLSEEKLTIEETLPCNDEKASNNSNKSASVSSGVVKEKIFGENLGHSVSMNVDLIDEFDDEEDCIIDEKCSTITSQSDSILPNTQADRVTADKTLESSIQCLQKKAIELKKSGDIQQAISVMKEIKLLRERQKSRDKPITNSDNNMKFKNDRNMKFAELEKLIIDFANRAMNDAKEFASTDRVWASALVKKRKAYASELEKLRVARMNPLQNPPNFCIKNNTRKKEISIASISANEIEVVIDSFGGLEKLNGKDVFIKFSLGFPSSSPHSGTTNTIRGESIHEFNSRHIFPIRRTSKTTLRSIEIRKASFEVWRIRGFFGNQELVGKCNYELRPLLSECELSLTLPLLDSNRRKLGGDLKVQIRLQTPFQNPKYEIITYEDLVIGDYPTIITPSKAVSKVPEEPIKSSTTAPKNSRDAVSVSKKELQRSFSQQLKDGDDPLSVDLIESYDVLVDELKRVGEIIDGKSGSSGELLEEAELRQQSLELKKQILEIEMQSGKLTLDMYVDRVRTRLSSDKELMMMLKKKGRSNDAVRVFSRVKVMIAELKGVEESAE